ncbi:hypothetical protein R5R35_010287 [Gryllus longicercus]|uniref:CHK kinase-like domain-containing protein n=1 Tax=Gryllus longicercus TaxID=2509291 RepID=A0AAN9Z111_9ORTH
MGESEGAGRPVAPAWLDAALVERALRAGGGGGGGGGGAGADTRVVGVRVEAANAAGDGYVSEMFRVRATLGGAGGAGGERRVVVKGPPAGERFRRLVLQSRTFVAEAQMFAQVVPKMERELEAVAPGRFPPFTARCLLWDTQPTHFLVLEDLAEGGFALAERRTGMDAAHARLALRALARFHAASAALLRREPAAMAAVANFFEQPVREMFAKAARTSLRGTAAAMRRWAPDADADAGRWTALADALARRAPAAFDAFAAATCRVDPGDLAVVLHGDFWLNNMLFRRDAARRPVDVRFVDLQLSHVGAPAADLLYFLYSSLDEETAAAPGAVDALLEEYRGALRDALQLLGLGEEAPTTERLQAAMDSRGAVALVAACCVLPITRCKTERVFDMEASLAAGEGEGEGDAAVEREAHLYCDAEYATTLRRVLPDFERRGWLQEEETKDVYST